MCLHVRADRWRRQMCAVLQMCIDEKKAFVTWLAGCLAYIRLQQAILLRRSEHWTCF